jgi:hypothetical protein
VNDGEVREEGYAEAAKEGGAGLAGTFIQVAGHTAGRFEAGFLASEGGGEDEGAEEGKEIICRGKSGVWFRIWRHSSTYRD